VAVKRGDEPLIDDQAHRVGEGVAKLAAAPVNGEPADVRRSGVAPRIAFAAKWSGAICRSRSGMR
jgi:hypothetical protein